MTAILNQLGVRLPAVKISAKRFLFHQGEAADGVFFIGSGQVHRMVTTEKGSERLVAILGAQDFCGEECLAAWPLRTTSAVVVEAADIVRIDRSVMSRLLQSPAFAELFTAFLLSRHMKTEVALIDQLVGSAEQRLRHVLARLATVEHSGSCTVGVIAGINQEMLAAMVGTTRPRINYFLNKLRRLGLIEYGGSLPRGEMRIPSIRNLYGRTDGLGAVM